MPGRTAADGDVTREALIDAAAELFASQGIEGVSIRSVNSHAGLGAASVHYHFGSKDRLLDAVLEREGGRVRGEIAELADGLLARRSRPTTRQLIETLAEPYLNLIQREPVRGIRWLKIVSQLIIAEDARFTGEQNVAVVSEKVQQLVRRRFPDTAHDELELYWRFAVAALIQMLSLTPADELTVGYADSPYKRAVVSFAIGGMDANVTRRKSPALAG